MTVIKGSLFVMVIAILGVSEASFAFVGPCGRTVAVEMFENTKPAAPQTSDTQKVENSNHAPAHKMNSTTNGKAEQ